MLCLHCVKEIHIDFDVDERFEIESDDGQLTFCANTCPSCGDVLVVLAMPPVSPRGEIVMTAMKLVYPKRSVRKPLPAEVPAAYAEDYDEACLVLDDSPKASAALSRRALQRLLHEHLTIDKGNLAAEIQALLASGQLPSYLVDALDSVRHVGNFAAHPIKDTNTGAIVDVEPGEAEWLVDTLEALYDFYFVQPALQAQRKAALNQKLHAAGKQPMK